MKSFKSQLFLLTAALVAILIIYALVDFGGPGSMAHKVWL